MTDVLLATDADWIFDDVDAALGGDGTTVRRVRRGEDVRPAIADRIPDLVVLDLQIGNMGGMATCISIRQDEGVDLVPHRPVLMLLDRKADVFLARRSQADGWMVKPIDSFRLRRAADALLAGEDWFEGVPAESANETDAAVDA